MTASGFVVPLLWRSNTKLQLSRTSCQPVLAGSGVKERIGINDPHLSATMEGLTADPSYICYPKPKPELGVCPQRDVATPAQGSLVF